MRFEPMKVCRGLKDSMVFALSNCVSEDEIRVQVIHVGEPQSRNAFN